MLIYHFCTVIYATWVGVECNLLLLLQLCTHCIVVGDRVRNIAPITQYRTLLVLVRMCLKCARVCDEMQHTIPVSRNYAILPVFNCNTVHNILVCWDCTGLRLVKCKCHCVVHRNVSMQLYAREYLDLAATQDTLYWYRTIIMYRCARIQSV